jgi:hypothetical protein
MNTYLLLLLCHYASGTTSERSLSELAADLDAIAPLSVQWLYTWARDEVRLDQLQALFDGKVGPIENASKRQKIAVAYFILSTNPEMDLDRFSAHMTRLLKDVPHGAIDYLFREVQPIFRIPNWLYQVIHHHAGDPKHELYEKIFALVERMKSSSLVNSRDARFNMGNGKIQALVHIWAGFGIGPNLPAEYNPISNEWTMTTETKSHVLRYMVTKL